MRGAQTVTSRLHSILHHGGVSLIREFDHHIHARPSLDPQTVSGVTIASP
jgi:hypothetical protein